MLLPTLAAFAALSLCASSPLAAAGDDAFDEPPPPATDADERNAPPTASQHRLSFDPVSLLAWQGKDVAVFTKEHGALSGVLVRATDAEVVVQTPQGNVAVTADDVIRISLLQPASGDEDDDYRPEGAAARRQAKELTADARSDTSWAWVTGGLGGAFAAAGALVILLGAAGGSPLLVAGGAVVGANCLWLGLACWYFLSLADEKEERAASILRSAAP